MDMHRVLIVDDEPVIRDLLSEDLSELGYLCEVAPDGNHALQKLAEEKFDITLLDIRLPGRSGIDILKEIKSRYDSAVIMITAVDDVNTAVISMKLGALDYIVKPFNLDTLNSSINSALEKNTRTTVASKIDNESAIRAEDKELQEMDSIARGIEVKLDFTDKRSVIVVQKTIEVARELGISEERIKQWEEKRATNNQKNLNTLKKFNQNAMAQTIMGVAKEYKIEGNSEKLEN